jgi:hypothetical protein
VTWPPCGIWPKRHASHWGNTATAICDMLRSCIVSHKADTNDCLDHFLIGHPDGTWILSA